MDPQLRHLRAFIAVAEERHFGRAARRLGIAQPAVSRHVRSLEEALGAVLLERTSRDTALTDAGRAALGPARDVLAAAERLRSAAHARGPVTVAFTASTTRGYAAAIAPLADIVQLPVAKLAAALRRGDVDLAVTRPLPGEDDLVQLPLATEPAVVALPATHRLAGRGRFPAVELDGEPFVAVDRGVWPEGYDALFRRLAERGCVPGSVRHTTSVAAALALVTVGAGVYRVAQSSAVPTPGVVYAELEDITVTVMLVRRPEPPRPAVQELIASLSPPRS